MFPSGDYAVAGRFTAIGPPGDQLEADGVVQIYAAGEEPIPAVSAELIVSSITQRGKPSVIYAPTLDAMVAEMVERAQPGDIVLTLGAGDVFKAGERLLKRLEDER